MQGAFGSPEEQENWGFLHVQQHATMQALLGSEDFSPSAKIKPWNCYKEIPCESEKGCLQLVVLGGKLENGDRHMCHWINVAALLVIVTSASPLSSGTAASIKWESVCCTSFTGLWWWIWQNLDLGWQIVLPYNWCGCGCWVLSIEMCEVAHCYETIKGLCIPLVPLLYIHIVFQREVESEREPRGGDFSALTSPHIPSHTSLYRDMVNSAHGLHWGTWLWWDTQPASNPAFAPTSCGYCLVGMNSCYRGLRWG